MLHLLTSIAPLPVTKEMVTTCRLGKAVVAVLKHSICVGTPNEKSISTRVQNVKTKWSEAVKALKNVSRLLYISSNKMMLSIINHVYSHHYQSTNAPAKRANVDDAVPVSKKVKREAPPAKPALSNLLKKVQHTNDKVAYSTDSRIKETETAPKEEVKAAAVQDSPKESLSKSPFVIIFIDSRNIVLSITIVMSSVSFAEETEEDTLG